MLRRVAARLRRLVRRPAPPAPPRDTDADWELIGQENPYYGVLVHPKFKTENLTEQSKAEFFGSGVREIHAQLAWLQTRFPDFAPGSALDFGCGVGRLTRPLGDITGSALGVDVSEAMLAEARREAPESVSFARDLPDRRFDWIVSLIVFQHIPPDRGYALLASLTERLADGGCVTLQFAIYRDVRHAKVAGGRIVIGDGVHSVSNDAAVAALARGEMVMFDYDLSVIVAILFAAGVGELELSHTDHGGFHGVYIRGRKSAWPARAS